MEGWVQALTGVAADGDCEQIYPSWAAVGADPATVTNGQWLRCPCEGILYNLQIMTDGSAAGALELYDFNGADAGANVSSLVAITDTQLDAAITAGNARLIYNQNFAATPTTPINISPRSFQKGLVGRFVQSGGSGGVITLSLVVQGGFRRTQKVG